MDRIIINNFGPIEYVDFKIEKNFNIIIGEQATGKSTIAKLIYFFKDIITDLESTLIRQPEKIKNYKSNKILNEYYLSVKKKFIISFGSYNLKNNSEITYIYENGQIAVLKINNNILNFYYDKNTERKVENIFDKALTILNDEKKNVDIKLQQISFYAYLINKLFENYKRHMFIPACRSRVMEFIGGGLTSFIPKARSTDIYFNYMLNNITYFRLFSGGLNGHSIYEVFRKNNNIDDDIKFRLDEMESIKKRILKGEYKWNKKNNKDFIKINEEQNIPIEYGSSGQQEAIWILNLLTMIMKENIKTFLIIEEPEAHLFPNAQLELVKLISLVINTTGSEIIITTHSPYILSSFNLLIFAGEVEKCDNEGIIKKYLRINTDNLGAYRMQKGKCLDIFDAEERLIKSEEIDEISECINEKFDELLEKNYKLRK